MVVNAELFGAKNVVENGIETLEWLERHWTKLLCFEDGRCAHEDDNRLKRKKEKIQEFESIMLPCLSLLGFVEELV